MSLQYFEEKISFYQNIFLSFYLFISILWAKNIECDVGLNKIQDKLKNPQWCVTLI